MTRSSESEPQDAADRGATPSKSCRWPRIRPTAASPPPYPTHRPRIRRGSGTAGTCGAALAVALPFLAAAVRLLATQHYRLAGDDPLAELAVRSAVHGQQLLGAYSRFGWSHPGPLWFYLLAPVYVAGGSSDASLLASQEVLHAVTAAVIVLLVGRWRGPWAAGATAGILLGYAYLMPDAMSELWNPYALPLPTILFLLLAARAATGSLPALGFAVFVGTFLVQTHVGTAALVAVVGALAVVGFASRRAWPSRQDGVLGGAALAATALAWLPPLVQQATTTPGNLGLLAKFATAPPADGLPHVRLPEAVDVVARALEVVLLGRRPDHLTYQDWTVHGATWRAGPVLVVALLLAASVALAFAGRRCGDRIATSLGVVSSAAVVAAVVSVAEIDGPASAYLVTWITVLPVVVAVGWVMLAVRFVPTARSAASGSRMVHTAVAMLVLVTTVAATAVVWAGTERTGACCDSPGAATVDTLADRAVAAVPASVDPSRAILVTVSPDAAAAWPMATAVLADLAGRGWHACPTPAWGRLWEIPSVTSAPIEVAISAPDAPIAPGWWPVGDADTEFGRIRLDIRAAT